MITAITGTIARVDDDRLHLDCGPVRIEVLVPAADVADLEGLRSREVTLHTVAYLEGEASGGNLTPRLIGFRDERDRDFFRVFVTVKGIGPRKALKALAVPAGEVARAIEMRDARALTKLPQIGKRAAELLIAELAGKVGRFVPAGIEATPVSRPSSPAGSLQLSEAEEEAVATLVALGERRADAEGLLARVRQQPEAPTAADRLVRAMLRLRSGPR